MVTAAEALTLGWKCQQAGDRAGAERLYRQAITAEPGNAQACYLLGVLLRTTGRPREAVAPLRQALHLDSRLRNAANHLGLALASLGEFDDAADVFRQALELLPDDAELHNNLGVLLAARRALDEAVAHYRHALRCRPDYAEAHNNLGVALGALGNSEAAIARYRAALLRKPDYAEAYNNLGNALRQQERHDEAIIAYREALRLRPDYFEAHNNLGVALAARESWPEATASYWQALRLQPRSAEAHSNLGIALAAQLRLEEALAHYDEALRLRPDHAEAHGNRAIAWLLLGDFARGWPEYEWRWRCPGTPRRDLGCPRWDGQPLDGRTVLLHAEQGLGDTLQFVRYAPRVKALGATVVVECQPPLAGLLARCPGIDCLVARGAPLPPFDVHAPLLSLPGLLGTSPETVPAEVPYLFADTARVERWRERLAGFPGCKIGIAWQPNPRHAGAGRRAVPLERFAPLARLPGVRLVSLQKGQGTEQLRGIADQFEVIDFGADLDGAAGPFLDTAAVMRVVDLVITADTATGHLAGGLGVPVWLALPWAPGWRWLLGREDSPWYPTMRLFRQSRQGDWEGIFERMATELRRRLTAEPPGAVAVEVAPGELIDKIVILEIKSARISDEAKLRNVRAELAALSIARGQLTWPDAVAAVEAELKAVNELLWDVEDEVRRCEQAGDFGPRFIALARSVYGHNDRRAALKRRINELVGARWMEEKAYALGGPG